MGRAGRPRKEISPNFLKESMTSSRRITFKKLAELAGVHRHTLRFYLKKHGMYQQFCDISESDLDTLVKTFKAKKPGSGLTYMIGFLQAHGLRVQRRRVRIALQCIDALGSVLHNHEAIDQQKYTVP
jgi:hypothetical protein